MKCIIAGSRSYHDDIGLGTTYNVLLVKKAQGLIQQVVAHAYEQHGWPSISEVVSGKAHGIDSFGEWWAHSRTPTIPVKQFKAKWEEHGKSAGYLRNIQMADYASPDGACLVIWDGVSKGCLHMYRIAKDRGLRVLLLRTKEIDGILTVRVVEGG